MADSALDSAVGAIETADASDQGISEAGGPKAGGLRRSLRPPYGAAKMSRPGYRPLGSGRPKGRQNSITKTLQDMILGALADVGGQAYLAMQATENPSAFLTLIGRVIPLQIKPSTDDPIVAVKRIIHVHQSSDHTIDHSSAESTETLSKTE